MRDCGVSCQETLLSGSILYVSDGERKTHVFRHGLLRGQRCIRYVQRKFPLQQI